MPLTLARRLRRLRRLTLPTVLTVLTLAGLLHTGTGPAGAQILSTNANLSSITVDGVAVPGVAPLRTSYEFGVAPPRVTLRAIPVDSRSTVTYSVTDADSDAAGHQVDLSEGRNTVTITITAEDTTTTKAYTLALNRSVYSQFGWVAEDDIDTLIDRGNRDPAGIFTDGETMWVADDVDDRIYGYDLSTGAANTRGHTLRDGNNDPTGIFTDGETMWVADYVDLKVYAYDRSTSLRDEDKEWDFDSDNADPWGLWSDGTTMWVSDDDDNKLYAYTLATGARDSDKDIITQRASGIWSDGTTIWVSDWVNARSNIQLFAYTLATGARDSDKDFATPAAAGNRFARGITSDGRTMWVADLDDDKIYAYALVARSTDATLGGLTVDGAAVPGLDPERTAAYEFGVAHDVSQVTVAATTNNSGASVSYSGTDADSGTAGHQVDLSSGRNEVTVTVTAEGRGVTKGYVLRVNRGYAAAYRWKAVDDIDTLITAGNDAPWGIWSDGTTMWVADSDDDKLYAYTLADGTRDSDKEWDLHSDNDSPGGIWSDETTMWVADTTDDKLYAYTLSTGTRDSTKDLDLHSSNNDPAGLWSDGSTIWVAQTNNTNIFAYTLSDGTRDTTKEITANLLVSGLWSDGETVWVVGFANIADPMTRVRAHRLSDGERDTSKDYPSAHTAATLSSAARGVWSDGETMWIADASPDKIYSFNTAAVTDATLSGLTVDGAEVPGVGPDRTGPYDFGVFHTVSQVTIAATPTDNAATVSYSATDADTSTDGHQVNLSSGRNTVTVTVTAADGTTTQDYVLRVTRGGTDTTLSSLTVDGAEVPGLDPDRADPYEFGVFHNVTQVTIAATPTDQGATVAYSGTDADSGTPGHQVDLTRGRNTVTVTVTAADGNTTQDHVLRVNRGGTDTTLSSLTVDGADVPGLDPERTDPYEYGVFHEVTQVTIAATPTHQGATVAYSGTDADADADGHQVDLSSGRNTVTVTVTAADGNTTKDYVLRVNRGGTDITLSSLTVDGAEVPGLDPERTTAYEFGVGFAVSQVTIAAPPTHQGATATFSVADADGGAPGRQVNLSSGRNEVTITVTAADGTTTKAYVLRVNRGFADAYKWKTVDDIDTLITAGNNNPEGIWSDGTTMWVADSDDNKLYAYTLADGTRDTAKEWDLHSDNTAPRGIWSDGTTMWVADKTDGKLYAYTLTTGARDTAKEWDLHADHTGPAGLWSDGTTIWVAQTNTTKIFAYTLSDGTRNTAKEITADLLVSDLWSDGETVWVVGFINFADPMTRVRAHQLSDGERDTSKDYPAAHTAATLSSAARGLWSDGETMWIADSTPDKIFSFNTGVLPDVTLSSLTVDGVEVPGFDPDRTAAYEFGVAHDVASATITATPNDSRAAVSYSVADRDPLTAGLQIDLGTGRNEVTVTVTSEGLTASESYVVRVNRGAADAYKWKATADIDSLITAGNVDPSGIWSDGATMWVVDGVDNKLYAYTLATGARDTAKEWDLHSDNADARDVWSDGTTMWVADQDDDKLYAYTLSTGARDTAKEWDLHSDNGSPRGIWSDGTTMWVADSIDNKLYAYALSDGDRDTDKEWNVPADSGVFAMWSDGETMWVAGLDGHWSRPIVHAFRLSDGTADTDKTYPGANLLEASISDPLRGAGDYVRGIWSDGVTLWLATPYKDKIYSFNTDPAEAGMLSALTVSPRDVVGFDGDRSGYEVGVGSTVARATITATAEHTAAEVSFSAVDADPGTAGHQVDLVDGRNEVAVDVTAVLGGELLRRYTVSVNRGVTADYGWRAERDLDGLHAAGGGAGGDPGPNTRPAGIWTDGRDFRVLDSASNRIYAYDSAGSFVAAKSFVPDTSSLGADVDLGGLWSDGETVWTSTSEGRVLAWGLDTGTADTSKDFNLHSDNGDPAGIWSDGEIFWVADTTDNKLYAYSGDGTRMAGRDIDATGPAAPNPVGVWSDGLTVWVVHRGTAAVYAHDLATGARLPALDFTALAPGNDNPGGVAGDGETLWVTQDDTSGTASKVFAYNLPPSENADLAALEVDGTAVAGFDPATTSYDLTVGAAVFEVTISAEVPQLSPVKAGITVSPADADPQQDGHQVALKLPLTQVTVTVTALSGATKTYTLNVTQPTLTDPPVVTAPDATVSEHAAVGATVASLSATDPEGAEPLTWALDSLSQRLFQVVATNTAGTTAELRLRGALDFETASSHQVTVLVTDPGNVTGEATLTVTVRNADDTGTLTLRPSVPSLNVGVLGELSDPDGGVAGRVWQWHRGDARTGPWTRIPGATSAAYTPADADLGKYLRLTVSYRDASGPGRSAEAVTSAAVAVFVDQIGYCYPGNTSCDLSRAGRVPVGGEALGQTDFPYDMDLFRVELEQGKTYVVDLMGRDSGRGTLVDPRLTGMFAVFNSADTLNAGMLDDDGYFDSRSDRFDEIWFDYRTGERSTYPVDRDDPDSAVAPFGYSDDDGGVGRDSRFFLKHFPAGAYYFMVRGYGGTLPGTYTVALNEAAETDADVTTMGLDVWQHGTIDFPDDADVFEMTLEAGETYSFVTQRTGWWNRDRAGYARVIQIEDVTTGTVTSLSNEPAPFAPRRPVTYTAANDGAHRITIKQTRDYNPYLRGGSYRVKVVNNILASAGTIRYSGWGPPGNTITLIPQRVADANGLPSPLVYSYQWFRSDRYRSSSQDPLDPGEVDDGVTWTAIEGATRRSYRIQQADVGHYLSVRYSFTDQAGNLEDLHAFTNYRPVPPTAVSSPEPGDNQSNNNQQGNNQQGNNQQGNNQQGNNQQGTPPVNTGQSGVLSSFFYDGNDVEDPRTSASTEALPDPPPLPTGLTVSSLAHNSVTLTWDDPGDSTIESYQVLRRSRDLHRFGDGGGAPEFVVVGETGSFTTTYTDTTVEPRDRKSGYVYRVKARNAGGLSEISRYVNADTPRRPSNRAATGELTIAGTARVGETLTADISAIADQNGLDRVRYSFQWLAGDADIAGATDSSYTLVPADLNRTIKVRVSFHDDAAYTETRTSAAVGPVGLYLRDKRGEPPTGEPAVSGEAREGVTLTADISGIADPDGLANTTFSYLWLAGDSAAEGATGSSYTPVGSDTGKAIKVVVVFLDDAGNREVLTSAATSPVEAAQPDPPSNLAAPAQAHNGVTLTWDDPGDSTIESYQVLRRSRDAARFGDNGGAPELVVVGEIDAPATSYTDTAVTPRTRYVYKLRAQNPGGPSELSAQVYAETPHLPARSSATGAPVVGGVARVGETLTVHTAGIADPDGLDNATFSYQWLNDDADIAGATGSSYTLVAADTAKTIRVRVSFDDDAGNAETLTSAPTLPVAAAGTVLPDPPAVPTGLAMSSRAYNRVSLVWDDPGDSAIENYQVLRRNVDGDTYGDGLGAAEFVVVGETGSAATTYTDTSVRPRTKYIYRVKAQNSGGLSDVSRYAHAETPWRPANQASGGLVLIDGSPQPGETLTVLFKCVTDGNGLDGVTFSYWWLADSIAIDGAGGASYTLTESDAGKVITVLVAFRDNDDHPEIRVSQAVGPVSDPDAVDPSTLSTSSTVEAVPTDPPPVPTGLAMSSRAYNRVSLVWDDPGDSAIENYQVLRRNIDGATYGDALGAAEFVVVGETGSAATTYTDTSVKARTRYIYRVKAQNSVGLSETSRYVHAETPTRPANRAAGGLVLIDGLPHVTETLTADTDCITDGNGLDNATFSYQWLADDADITGATGSTYTPVRADLTKNIKVRVSFSDDADYSETLTSAAVGPVSPPSNRPATGAPAVTGTARVGETLTADTSGIADANGLSSVTYSYQWLTDDADIAGATSSTYTPVAADLAKTIMVRVSFSDDTGNAETLTSAPTAAVLDVLPDPPSSPTGLAVSSQTHNAVSLVWDDPGDDTIESYQVLRRSRDAVTFGDGRGAPEFVAVGETDSAAVAYTDTSVTPRTRYVYRVKARNAGGLSGVSGYANAETPQRPANSAATGAPAVTGTAQVGKTLTADTSGIADANGLDNATFSYQWLADDTDIAGATSSTYTPVRADLTKSIKVRVSFSDDDDYPETLTSTAVGPVDHQTSQLQQQQADSAATGAPTVTGTARVGETLTADTAGIADANGLNNVSFSYQWLADDADIAGATSSTYTPVAADLAKTIKVRVSFSDDTGNAETLTSAPTAAVLDVLPDPPSSPTGLAVSSQTHNAVSLVWDDPGDDTIESYQVLRRSRDAVTFGDGRGAPEFVAVGETDSAAVAYTDTSVTPRTRYVYRVKARNAGGLSGVSGYANAETPQRPANSAATGAPTVTGTAQVGETLTADTSGIADTNGLDRVSFSYQWLADDTDIAGATSSTYTPVAADLTKSIKVRVSFSDDAGNAETLTSAATAAVALPRLTATVHDAPDSHDGNTVFTFELRFSEELRPDFGYATLRDDAFTITGGTVTGASRIERPENGVNKNIRWRITIDPDTNGTVTITLPSTEDCEANGAICTQDHRMFSGPLELTVPRSQG